MENSGNNNDRPSMTPIDINPSKQTMYIQHAENILSPKLNNKDNIEEVNFLEIEEHSYLRNTQPAFQLSLEKTSSDIKISRSSTTNNQADTPTKLRSVSKLKEKSKQKDLLREIANTQERRPYNLQYHQQQRKFRNTANSFASDQDSIQQPESVHNMPNNKGNDDLADVSPMRSKEKEMRTTQQSNSKQKRYKKANVALTMRPAPQLTNLTQAYTEGVSKLISTLPFKQQKQLKPIVSASLDMKSLRSPGAQARQNMMMREQLFRASQESHRSLPKDSLTHGQETLRKSIQVNKHMHFQSQLTDDSHQNSGQLHSNRSLGSGFPLQAIKSSIFRIEQAQDYTDLKLDFTSKIMTEHQSQNLLETLQPNIAVGTPKKSGDKKVHIKSKLGALQNMSQPQGLPSMAGPGYKKHCPSARKNTMDHMLVNTTTERRILGILDKTDYHTLRQHADPAGQSTSAENCTCYNHPNHTHEHNEHHLLYRKSIVSQSIDYSQLNMTNHNAFRMTDKSPKPDQGAYAKEPRNILSIQLRPLKGKAEHLREYRDMIEKEYGKEKKKQIYETMYSEVSRSPQAQNRASSLANPFIKLNLRSEQKREPYKPRRNQHVKLQTISPRGEVDEKLVPLDKQKAERMNTTFNSNTPFSMPTNEGFQTLAHSTSRWRPGQAMTQRQFYLFSPSGLQMANQRYQHEHQKDENKSQASIVNLKISSGDDSKKNRGNQINLGYVGLHEQNLAQEYVNYLMQDETTMDSVTDLGAGGQAQIPFGRIYSRMSMNNSKFSSQKTPKPANQELEQSQKDVKTKPIQNIQSKKTPNKTNRLKMNQNSSPQNQKNIDKNITLQRQSNIATTSARQKDSVERQHKSKSKDPVFHRSSNLQQMKPYFVLPKKKSPVEKNLRHTKRKYNNREIGIKIDEAPQDEHSQDGEQVDQDSNKEFFPNTDHVTSLAVIEQIPNKQVKNKDKDYDDTTSGEVNPMDQYDSTELLAINQSQQFELFSNPTEIEIQTTSYQQSSDNWESKKKLQQSLILQKQIKLKNKDQHMGPLERKPIKLQKQNNNIRLSQISVVNEFYKEEEEGEQDEQKRQEEKIHPYIQLQQTGESEK